LVIGAEAVDIDGCAILLIFVQKVKELGLGASAAPVTLMLGELLLRIAHIGHVPARHCVCKLGLKQE